MTTLTDRTVGDRLDEIAVQVSFLVAEAQDRSRNHDSLSELVGDATPLARQGFDTLANALQVAQEKGYADFARSGLLVASERRALPICSHDSC